MWWWFCKNGLNSAKFRDLPLSFLTKNKAELTKFKQLLRKKENHPGLAELDGFQESIRKMPSCINF